VKKKVIELENEFNEYLDLQRFIAEDIHERTEYICLLKSARAITE